MNEIIISQEAIKLLATVREDEYYTAFVNLRYFEEKCVEFSKEVYDQVAELRTHIWKAQHSRGEERDYHCPNGLCEDLLSIVESYAGELEQAAVNISANCKSISVEFLKSLKPYTAFLETYETTTNKLKEMWQEWEEENNPTSAR